MVEAEELTLDVHAATRLVILAPGVDGGHSAPSSSGVNASPTTATAIVAVVTLASSNVAVSLHVNTSALAIESADTNAERTAPHCVYPLSSGRVTAAP